MPQRPDPTAAPMIGPRLVRPGLARLAALSSDLERRHGPLRALANQPDFIVASAARKRAADGDFHALDARENKAALDLFWRDPDSSTLTPRDVANWLEWAEAEWRPNVAPTRICATLLRHYDSDHIATPALLDWLKPREPALWGRFGDFARRWRLVEGDVAIEQIAQALASGELSFFHDLDRSLRVSTLVQGSGWAVALAECYGRLCSSFELDIARKIIPPLLALLGPRGLDACDGPEKSRAAARIALVSGIVTLAARAGDAPAIDFALDLAFALARDPRVDPTLWRDMPEAIVDQVDAWLVERTLNATFKIIAELNTDDADVLARRREFWRFYLPHIKRARLLCAPKAREAAERLGEPSCVLHTYLGDHCGVLLELKGPQNRRLVVVEINNRAQTMFWGDNDPGMPGFLETGYDRSRMRAQCALFLSHIPPDLWPEKFAELIESRTGLGLTPH
jgi:hypothetical protein